MKYLSTLLGLLGLVVFSNTLSAQDNPDDKYISRTFKDSRIINVHSVETLPARKLDVRIAHRFGDLAGENGGFATFFGLENASDVMIGAEYGFSNNLTIGLYRTKGAGSTPNGEAGLNQLLNGVFKYRFLRQTKDDKNPVSITGALTVSGSTAEKVDVENAIRSFPKFSHRFAFNGQLLISRQFSDGFSLQFIPGYTHRNLVPFEGENGIFSLGVATRIQLSRTYGIIADATFPFSETFSADNGYYPAIGIGLEIETSGHVFQVNFTNATGIIETDFIPYTTTNWLDGEFRLGFTISRLFNL